MSWDTYCQRFCGLGDSCICSHNGDIYASAGNIDFKAMPLKEVASLNGSSLLIDGEKFMFLKQLDSNTNVYGGLQNNANGKKRGLVVSRSNSVAIIAICPDMTTISQVSNIAVHLSSFLISQSS